MAPEKFKIPVDKSKPGQYLSVTRETHPERFDQGDGRQRAADARKALDLLLRKTIYGPNATRVESEQANLRIERELSEGLDVGAGPRPAPSDAQSIAQGQADALDVDDAPWKKNKPRVQPLTYAIPTNPNGGKGYRRIKFEVDFSDADSVEKANKIRRQGLYRAGQRLNLPLKRPSTQGRQFTQANNNWIIAKYNDYARDNDGARITMAKLHEDYQKQFPAEDRTQSSLATHIDRIDYLRAHKSRFPPK